MTGWTRCWLAENATWERPGPRPACDGALRRVHLIPRALLKREGFAAFGDDPRGWVVACGGPMGNGGCNGRLDVSRTLRVARDKLPPEVEAMACDLGLEWWLTREYGELCEDCGAAWEPAPVGDPGCPSCQTANVVRVAGEL